MSLTVRNKLILGILALITVVMIVVLLNFHYIRRQGSAYEQLLVVDRSKLVAIERIRAYFASNSLKLRDYVLFQDHRYLQGFQEGNNILERFLTDNTSLNEDLETSRRLQELQNLNERHKKHAQKLSALISNNESMQAVVYLDQNESFLLEQITSILDKWSNDLLEHTSTQTDVIAKERRQIIFISLAILALGIIVSITIGYLISVNLTRPLTVFQVAFERIASGDFTVKVPVTSDDEIGKLGENLNLLTDNVSKLIREVFLAYRSVREGALEIAQAVEKQAQVTNEVSHSIDLVASSAQDQQKSIEQVNEAMDHLSSAILQVNQGTKEQAWNVNTTFATSQAVRVDIDNVNEFVLSINEDVKANAEAAKKGQAGNLQLYHAMQNIEKGITEASESVTLLEQGSKKIEAIVKIINDISDQTNLLALNAAIEAARAGEQGRGFAVVAEEVRKLAAKTRESTNDIANIINEIRLAIKTASEAVEVSYRNVQEGTDISEKSKEQLDQMVESANKINTRVEDLKNTSLEIQKKSHSLELNINNMAAITKESSKAMQEISTSSKEFNDNLNNIAFTSKENAVFTEEVAAAIIEQTATLEEISSSAAEFVRLSERVSELLDNFQV